LVPTEELWTWNENKVFKNLQDKNIFSIDFFDFLVDEKSFHDSLDLIIGNPPFKELVKKNIKNIKKI